MSDEDIIIKVENLTASYNSQTILDDISFNVRKGEIFVILGGSGSGKSTLLKHMIRIHEPDRGKVFIDGDDIISAEGKQLEKILRKIGVTFQSGALFGSMTLLENVRLPLEEYTNLPREAMNLVASMKLDLVGLRGFGNHLPSELSGGMKKRAAIARAMALDPQIVFLDEPSAGLDPVTSADLDQLILNLAGALNMTFVIVTHELPSVFAVSDRVILLEKQTKKIVASGTAQQLRDDKSNPWSWQFFHRHTGQYQRGQGEAADKNNKKTEKEHQNESES
jgi:phospholipid/cholesterol/gamma-HCH transport system ATP-binding protein